MRLFGYELSARRVTSPAQPVAGSGGWWPVIRESYTGAWQENVEVRADTVLAYWAVFACTTLIAADIGKLTVDLVEQDADDVWQVTTSPAFSPVLRKPNRYQTINRFVESWILSKLIHGNAYALKARDARGVVVALYVLDPTRVQVLVAADGGVYYQLTLDYLNGVTDAAIGNNLVVPASEIIHDPMSTLYHPLVGVSPIYACGMPALQGLKIQDNSTQMFANGAKPGAVIIAPGAINDASAKRVKDYWEQNFTGPNAGRVAVLGDNMKYEAVATNPVDLQLIDQLGWTEIAVCGCYHVPIFMIDLTKTQHAGIGEAATLQYHGQCLQPLITSLETALEDGLALPDQYGIELDIDDLIWLDTATRTKAASDAIHAGALSPNEARRKYFGLGPVAGGDSPYLQQQMFSLAALAQRDTMQPFVMPPDATPAAPNPSPSGAAAYRQRLTARVLRKAQERGLLHAA